MRTLLLLLLLPLATACQAAPTGPKQLDWRHMVGSNADELWVTEVLFYRQGKSRPMVLPVLSALKLLRPKIIVGALARGAVMFTPPPIR